MPEFKKLVNGEIEFRLPAEDEALLDELVRQERRRQGRRNRQANAATILIPLIQDWCHHPRRMVAVAPRSEPSRVDVRALYDDQKDVCRRFVRLLQKRREKSASRIISALLREHLEPCRKNLEDDARRFHALARQRRSRARKQLAASIHEFLATMDNGDVSRALVNLDADAGALEELGCWVAEQFAGVTKAKARYDNSKANIRNQDFAAKLNRILVYGLPPRSDFSSSRHTGAG